jgi:hypothetical protein
MQDCNVTRSRGDRLKRPPLAIAWLVVCVWLASAAYAFWSFEFKSQRPFESRKLALFDSVTRYQPAVHFVAVERTDSPELSWIPATPAALVFDAAGKLVYFGPYSDSARCGASGGFVERVLDSALRGQSMRTQPFYGSGCFCGGTDTT